VTIRRIVCVVVAAAALATASSPARAAGPDALGVYAEEVAGLPPPGRDVELAHIAAIGFGLVRSPLYWADVERSPGVYDLARTDEFVAALARNGLRWLPVIVSTPPFRAAGRSVDADGRSYDPPQHAADLGAFAAMLVRRYGRDGSFWADHPELPALPVHSWQVWNEPNIPAFWRSGIDPARYAALLRVTSSAIHAVDTTAEVVAAGLPDTSIGMSLQRFLEGFYAAGGAGSYDTFALHAYEASADGVVALARTIRTRMTQAGDRAPMWITEVGWATGGLRSPLTVDEDRQPLMLERALRGLVEARGEIGLRGIVMFKWRDTLPPAGERDIWPHHTGALRADGSAKPAFAMLARTLPELATQLALPPGQAPARPRARAACRSRRIIMVRLPLRRGERVRWAFVQIAGRQMHRVRVRRGRVRVDLRGLPRRAWGVGIVARTADGRRVIAARRFHTCTPRRR
jgi:hypothetical protein